MGYLGSGRLVEDCKWKQNQFSGAVVGYKVQELTLFHLALVDFVGDLGDERLCERWGHGTYMHS